MLVIPELNETGTYTFHNAVSSEWNYCWSGDQQKKDDCDLTVSAGEAKLQMEKRMPSSNGYFGTATTYEIELSNKGTLPYEKLCYVRDPLPGNVYLTASGLEALFNDKDFVKEILNKSGFRRKKAWIYGLFSAKTTLNQYFLKGASASITDATFCPDGEQNQTVTGMDGTTTGTTAARNTSENSDTTKYSGCGDSAQHHEDHTGSIDICWNDEHTQLKLIFTKADGSTSTRTCAADAASIQAALDAENYLGIH